MGGVVLGEGRVGAVADELQRIAGGRAVAGEVDDCVAAGLLTVEAKSSSGSATSFVLPLGGFVRAYEGPPADPKVLARQEDDVRKPWKDWKDDRLDPKIVRKSIQ